MSNKIEKRSPYRMGWIMAMFDLPVLLEEERKEATRFRNALLDDGFIMIQYSVFICRLFLYIQMA